MGCTVSSVLWLGKLNAVFSKGQATVSFPAQIEQENCLQGWQDSLFMVLTQVNPCPRGPNRAAGFALQSIISACHTL